MTVRNAMSVDVEDWFCVYVLSEAIKREDWDRCELRIQESTRRMLDLLGKRNTRATFFVLGYVAERLPELVRDIEARGHEIATHGYGHRLLTKMTPEEFEGDLAKSLEVLRSAGVKQQIIGYRAPSFTIVKQTTWALDILRRHGIRYDSSVFPIGFHPDYGMPAAPLAPYEIAEGLREFPMSVAEVFGRRLPCSGGAYFRVFPLAYFRYCIRKINRDGRPVVFYLHPWEVDPGQPRVKVPLSRRFRQYHNLHKTQKRLDSLLGTFQFTTIREVLGL